jgi:hypothetical protein
MNTAYKIEVNLAGDVQITQITTLSLTEYLQQAGQVHQFAVQMRGQPARADRPQLTGERSFGEG